MKVYDMFCWHKWSDWIKWAENVELKQCTVQETNQPVKIVLLVKARYCSKCDKTELRVDGCVNDRPVVFRCNKVNYGKEDQ